jgi:hypothetical protein
MTQLNLEIDGEQMTFQIPDSWNEVSVEKFTNIWKINREGMTAIEITIAVVNVLTGIDEDYLYMMSPSEFSQITSIIEFTNHDVKGNEVEFIMIGEDKYYLKKDFDKLTMGEVISLELLIEQASGNVMSKMPEILCIFLRKKNGDKLESFKKGFMERAEVFKQASIADVNDIFLFFSDGVNSSTSNTKESLEK